MKRSFDFRPWVKPALTILTGFVLIFRPGSLTTTLAWIVGLVIALVGAGKMVHFFSGAKVQKDFWSLAGAIILLVLGLSILKNPVSLEKQLSRIAGILLILQAVRGYVDPMAAHEQVTSTLMCIAGAVLVLMPLVVPRLVVVICGVVVLVLGIGMVLDLLRGDSGCSGGNGEIIDAR